MGICTIIHRITFASSLGKMQGWEGLPIDALIQILAALPPNSSIKEITPFQFDGLALKCEIKVFNRIFNDGEEIKTIYHRQMGIDPTIKEVVQFIQFKGLDLDKAIVPKTKPKLVKS